jgi:hypothetical protein
MYILTFMLISYEIMKGFSIRLSVWCLIRNGSCMPVAEKPRMAYVIDKSIYMYIEPIQTSSLFSGNYFSLSVSRNAPYRSPCRNTFLDSRTKSLLEDSLA